MPKPIGELLVRERMISLSQLQKAIEEQRKVGGRLNEHLVKMGFVKDSQLAGFIAKQFNIPVAELDNVEPDPELLKLLPVELCQKHCLVPVRKSGQQIVIAIADPGNLFALDDVKFLTGMNVELSVAGEVSIRATISRFYGTTAPAERRMAEKRRKGEEEKEELNLDSVGDVMDILEVITPSDEAEDKKGEQAAADAPIVKLVNLFMVDAITKGASDIHIEPYEKFMRVRYRIDGVMYEILKPPLALRAALASRIKVMAGMNISEKRLPQDGRIRLKIGSDPDPIDFRVCSLPTIFGERIVLRILRRAGLQEDMTKLGLEIDQLGDYKWAITQPYGMVLVTGPAGCGKTTSLYSALMELNQPNVNVNTVEDPVEYNIHSLNQVQVRPEVGLTFASALRSFLRQDPDIIMVGEIRDLETAEIAIKSALTGHLVLSTLHTNDAPSTITRLLNMGVEPFLVASAVLLIVAQRLVRKVCTACKEQVPVDQEALIQLGMPEDRVNRIKIFRGKGCKACSNIGYKGRVGIYEVLRFNREMREAILRGESTSEIRRIGLENGMITLRQAALKKLEGGVTSLEEVVRTTAIVR